MNNSFIHRHLFFLNIINFQIRKADDIQHPKTSSAFDSEPQRIFRNIDIRKENVRLRFTYNYSFYVIFFFLFEAHLKVIFRILKS